MGKLVMGVFDNRAGLESAIQGIMDLGYSPSDVSVLMTDETRTREFGIEPGSKAAEGAGIGGAVGAAVGAVVAAIAAAGASLVVPGIGLVVAGPIAAALAGAGAGGVTGGILGALIGAGIPEYRAKAYEKDLREGGIFVGVEAKSDDDVLTLEKLFEDLGAKKVTKE
jgi:hypothetical protein